MTRIQVRRGSAGDWATLNPILSQGEPGYSDDGTLKIGNGSDPWLTLDGIASDAGETPTGGYTTDASGIVSGVFGVARIPDLDAAKITTGVLSIARIPSLDTTQIGSGTFATARIPSLDATKVTTGAFDLARIPALPASQITTGLMALARIPGLPAAQITSGIIDPARLPAASGGTGGTVQDASQIVSGVFSTARIPDLDAAKIISGTFSTARIPALPYVSTSDVSVLPVSRIPSLDTSKITTGVFSTARIPALPYVLASDTSVFAASRIPTLDASKVTTGVFDPARIPAIDVDVPDIRGANVIVNPGFEYGSAPHYVVGGTGAVNATGGPHTGQFSGAITLGDVVAPLDIFVPNGAIAEERPQPALNSIWTFECWTRAQVGVPTLRAFIKTRDLNNATVQTEVSPNQVQTGGWQKHTVTMTVTASTSKTILCGLSSMSHVSTDQVRIDDMMFRQVFEDPSSGNGGETDLTPLTSRVTTLERTSATIEEMVVSVSQQGRWAGTPSAWANSISGVGDTYSQGIFVAPYACRVASFDIVRDFGTTALSATNYLESQLMNGTNVISVKRTSAQEMAPGVVWPHDAGTFNTFATLAKGQRLEAKWNSFGTASMRFPCIYTFRIVPL